MKISNSLKEILYSMLELVIIAIIAITMAEVIYDKVYFLFFIAFVSILLANILEFKTNGKKHYEFKSNLLTFFMITFFASSYQRYNIDNLFLSISLMCIMLDIKYLIEDYKEYKGNIQSIKKYVNNLIEKSKTEESKINDLHHLYFANIIDEQVNDVKVIDNKLLSEVENNIFNMSDKETIDSIYSNAEEFEILLEDLKNLKQFNDEDIDDLVIQLNKQLEGLIKLSNRSYFYLNNGKKEKAKENIQILKDYKAQFAKQVEIVEELFLSNGLYLAEAGNTGALDKVDLIIDIIENNI